MKVLFAVSNEEISEMVVKKYQKEYKEIISYKNVYYFNAILKELQKDKTYDRIIISEDLEAFTHTQYDQIDKFIFEKLDNITDEATNIQGEDIPIILICSDRRTKSEQMLLKIFGIGIYNALIENDRSIDKVCELINKPRSKREAKSYYKIDTGEVKYTGERENDVDEIEVQNILAHYKRLGNDEDKIVRSFDDIAEQYNDIQLKIICKVLPLNVKAVLEEKSPRYQKLMAFTQSVSDNLKSSKVKKLDQGTTAKLLKPKNIPNVLSKPVVIPSSVNMTGNTKLSKPKSAQATTVNQGEEQSKNIQTRYMSSTQNQGKVSNIKVEKGMNIQNSQSNDNDVFTDNTVKTVNKSNQSNSAQDDEILNQITNLLEKESLKNQNTEAVVENTENVEKPKKKRGRPPKKVSETDADAAVVKPKKKRGRPPKKVAIEEDNITLPGFDEVSKDDTAVLPGFDEPEKNDEDVLSGFEDYNSNDVIMPGFEDNVQSSSVDNNQTSNNYSQNSFDEEDEDDSFLPGMSSTAQENDDSEDILPGWDEISDDDSNVNTNTNASIDTNSDINSNLYANNNTNMNSNVNSYSSGNYMGNSVNQNFQNSNVGSNNYSSNGSMYNQQYSEVNTDVVDDLPYENVDISGLLTGDKKVACFVGTSKNGTSFIVNNVAQILASMGVNTAILDTTKNRNSYYIYTKNEEELRNVASNTLRDLISGQPTGIQADKNLTVYTSLPEDYDYLKHAGQILQTIVKNHTVVLIDCDFSTSPEYFAAAQEIYLVQSLDVLTIQPLTAFLRELKGKNILEESKIKIVINKAVKVRGVNEKAIIGGMAFYNDPSMSYMTELFDRNIVKYIIIPFDGDVYAKYLGSLVDCEISLKGYPKQIRQTLDELANMIYPQYSAKKSYTPPTAKGNKGNSAPKFSESMNSTLNQMRKY